MPELLELALECDQYRALPFSGGIMEQPAGLMRKLRQVGNVYKAFKAYERDGKKPGESAKWKKANAEIWEIISQVEELRKTNG